MVTKNIVCLVQNWQSHNNSLIVWIGSSKTQQKEKTMHLKKDGQLRNGETLMCMKSYQKLPHGFICHDCLSTNNNVFHKIQVVSRASGTHASSNVVILVGLLTLSLKRTIVSFRMTLVTMTICWLMPHRLAEWTQSARAYLFSFPSLGWS